jgi:hypothetical protein
VHNGYACPNALPVGLGLISTIVALVYYRCLTTRGNPSSMSWVGYQKKNKSKFLIAKSNQNRSWDSDSEQEESLLPCIGYMGVGKEKMEKKTETIYA